MAGTHLDPALIAKLARRSELNYESMVAFAAAMGCFLVLFMMFRMMNVMFNNAATNVFPLAITRKATSLLLGKVPGLPTAGHLIVVLMYACINLIITFTNMDNENLPLHSNISSRTGWMATANLLIVVFLSLKNTPLAFLTGFSHERLNFLHRVSGYTTVIFVIIHGCSYTTYFAAMGRISRLTELDEIYGTIAGFSFLLMAVSGGLIRRWWYELFYYVHITFWILSIVMVGLHQPELAKKVLYVTCVTAGIWLLDRVFRLLRLALHATNNSVLLTPLPHGGTRVTLAKPPMGAKSGKHCFLWIPGIRLFEAHPFTIAATHPVEFVVASYDGFTRDLHQRALKLAGMPLRASVEGPYGVSPNTMTKDKIILIAGGSGASFAVGAALDLLGKIGDENKVVEFIWMVKNRAYVTWFAHHLKTLRNDHRFHIRIYVTRHSGTEFITTALPSSRSASSNPSLSLSLPALNPTLDLEKLAASSPETPTSATASIQSSAEIPVIHERPDIAALILKSIRDTPKDKSVLVSSCGPERLMAAVRDATLQCVQVDGPSVELHCEQFGW